jgi:triacylglycerol lipase
VRSLVALLAAVAALALAALPTAAAAADPPPPGANDWSCRPGEAHPRPVVLLHGLGANMAANWSRLSPHLAGEGYCVFALTYGKQREGDVFGGLRPMEESAAEIGAFVERVRAATGAPEVDIVGHSEGTVVPRYYFKFLRGADKVDRFVALTPLYDGTTFYGLSNLVLAAERLVPALADLLKGGVAQVCGSCRQLLTGSDFLERLNAGGKAVPGVTYTNIMTRYDETVIPYTSGFLHAPNATNIVLQDDCALDLADHIAVAFDPVAADHILNALDPQHARPARCTVVLPFIGGGN